MLFLDVIYSKKELVTSINKLIGSICIVIYFLELDKPVGAIDIFLTKVSIYWPIDFNLT